MEMKRAQCFGRIKPAGLENGFETELGTFKFEVRNIIIRLKHFSTIENKLLSKYLIETI